MAPSLPLWQRRGTGLCWEDVEKPGYDPLHAVEVTARRRRLRVETALPSGERYGEWLRGLLGAARGQGDG